MTSPIESELPLTSAIEEESTAIKTYKSTITESEDFINIEITSEEPPDSISSNEAYDFTILPNGSESKDELTDESSVPSDIKTKKSIIISTHEKPLHTESEQLHTSVHESEGNDDNAFVFTTIYTDENCLTKYGAVFVTTDSERS